MEEPSMLAEKPSSSHFQYTSHILRSTFNHLFTQDSVDTDTIRNLSASRRGKNDYHDKYVERLLQVHNKWSENVEHSRQIVQYVDKARNDARNLEAKEHEMKVEEFQSYTDLGLPPVSSKLRLFIDDRILKQHNLICPDEIFQDVQPINREASEKDLIRQYESSTHSSRQLFDKNVPEDCYAPKSPIIYPANSNVFEKKPTKQYKKVSKADSSKSDKNVWRSCVNPLQRDIEKKDLRNLQNKADFLKNPKSVAVPKSFLNKKTEFYEGGACLEYFKPSPCPVIFSDYEVQKSYQVRLELKNVTSSCKQVRILQPTSKYFSVSQGEFPTEDALVAPGMSCNYVVTFTPDTLGNYEDTLTVKTQAKEPMLIPLQAKRDPPILSLPRYLDCGCSLVGDKRIVEYVVQNGGGSGKFRFLLENKDRVINWTETDFIADGPIDHAPFTLTPSSFKLDNGESIKLQLTFAPSAVRVFTLKLSLLCDNCSETEYHIEGKGEMPHVELSRVEEGILSPCLGEVCDETAPQIIQFGKRYPSVVCEKELLITNTVSVPLEYCWDILLPSVSSNREINKTIKDPVFTVRPKSGYICGNAVERFHVLFSPSKIGNFYEIASLALKNIPVKENDKYVFQDEVSMKLSLKGSAQEYSMNVHPAAVIMSGDYFVGTCYYRTVTLQNCCKAPTSFKWKDIVEDKFSVIVTPSEGIVGVDESVECLLTICGKKVGAVYSLIDYEVPFSSKKHVLHFTCSFKGPYVSFCESSLSFGLARCGTSLSRNVSIINNSPINASWKITDEDAEVNNTESPYSFYPQEGSLDAQSLQEITVSFHPFESKTVANLFKCTIEDGDPCYLPVHAEVQHSEVYLEKCEIVIDEAFLNVPIEKKITLINANILNAAFNWNMEIDPNLLTVSYEPKTGVLESQERLVVSVKFLFHSLGDVEYLIVCQVEDMLKPLLLCVKAKVNGLKVDITMPNMEDIKHEKEVIRNNDILEFGMNNLIGEPADVFVMLENKSAIETSFEVYAKEFKPSRVPTPPKADDMKPRRGSSCRPLISRNFPATKPPKSQEQERKGYINSILQDGQGITFVCSPAIGILSAFETKIITVTAYTDMWGEYEDTLICKIGDLDERLIPIHIDVIGCPLNFQICKEQPAMLRFGSHVSGDKAVTRNLRINNTSHCDIRLDWKSYVIVPDDEKLVDLNIHFGNPFPSYDDNGCEEVDEKMMDDELIKVTLDEHYGNESVVPFSIINTQVIIRGKGEKSIDACFQPPIGLMDETKYLGYALGYMSLQGKDCCKPGMYSRQHGLDMVPFSLNMTGSVKPARLHLETCDEDGFGFTLSASDLMDAGQLRKIIQCEKRFVISNRCDTTKEFSCLVESPFRITSFGERKKMNNKKKMVLKPHENIEIRLLFEITPELAASIYQEQNLQVYRNLSIEFANNDQQVYQLTGKVDFPTISVSEEIIDFGVCFVGAEKQRGFTISNLSKVLLRWNIEKDLHCPLASQTVFSFSVSNGTLDGNVAGVAGSDVKFYFTPKHNVDYECNILIHSLFRRLCLKDEPIKLVLRGAGSYDEAHRGSSDISL